MTKVYYSISKTVVFKNFVPKQGLILSDSVGKKICHVSHTYIHVETCKTNASESEHWYTACSLAG
jgi:hypothetical protein